MIKKLFRYAYNLIRFSILKMSGKYNGSVVQGVPVSTAIDLESGALEVHGKIRCRKNVYISTVGGKLEFGEECFLNQNVHVVSMESIKIGKNVIMGPNVTIVDHDHDYKSDDMAHNFKSSPIIIEDNVWIGANAVILRGTHIGKGSVVSAGGVLKGDYPDNSLVLQSRDTHVKEIRR